MRSRVLVAAIAVSARARRGDRDRERPPGHQANTLTVWLQVDAQSGWPDLVAAANQQFQADHPGWTVNVQYQNWSDHLQKFDATLAGNNTPDVIEMGNTEMVKYMAAGAFADLSSDKSTFDNSANWLKGLAKSGMYGGKIYGVPYYAGSRVVTYRTDLYKKAGITKAPTSLAAFTADLAKLAAKNSSVKGFSPVYTAGTDWYFAMSFVYDYGGKIASTYKGKWVGDLDSKNSIAGLTAFKNFFNAALEGEPDLEREHSGPVHRVLAGPHGCDRRAGLVQLLRRQDVHGGHRAVRDAEPHAGPRDAGLPRRLRPRSPGAERQQDAGDRSGSRTSRARATRRRCRRRATSRTRPTCSATASTSGQPPAAGSSRRRSTGSTSRTGISCTPCWRRS